MLLPLIILFVFLLILLLAISRWNVHPFVALLLVGLGLGLAMGMGGRATAEALLDGFGGTLRWIAIVVILGAFIGEVLQETGGAVRISNLITRGGGDRRLPWAMGITGYLISIPVFVDVAYILMRPIVESLAARNGKPVLFVGLALTAGLTVSHTLIPPTPGPLAVASLLEVDLGRMILVNLFVAAFAMAGGVFFVITSVKNTWLPRDKELKAELSQIEPEASAEGTASKTSRVVFDLLPIILPIVIIALGSSLSFEEESLTGQIFKFVSIPTIAVLIGAVVAGCQFRTNKAKTAGAGTINQLVDQAILKSALVIIITGAGGALGAVIKQSGVQEEVVEFASALPVLGMLLPFFVAALLTTATGSITVSLVSTAAMIGPMVETLPVSPELAAALIGCGAFCVFHGNSSFFWLLNRLHEVPPKVLYRTYTVQSLVMGISGLVGVFLLKMCGF